MTEQCLLQQSQHLRLTENSSSEKLWNLPIMEQHDLSELKGHGNSIKQKEAESG